MSTPRYDWWPYVKGMIRRYPELCRQEAARDRLFQLSMPMWVENGRAFHE